MKTNRVVLFLVMVFAGLLNAADLRPIFRTPCVVRAERVNYLIKSAGVVVGEASIETSLLPDGKYFIKNKISMPNVTEVSEVIVSSDAFKPLHMNRSSTLESGDLTIKADYSDRQVKLYATSADGKQEMPLRIPLDTFDNDEVLTAFRFMDFEKHTKFSFNILANTVGRVYPSDLTVVGKETVVVPAGKYLSTKLRLDVSGASQFFWCSQASFPYIVKYDNGTTSFELVSVVPTR